MNKYFVEIMHTPKLQYKSNEKWKTNAVKNKIDKCNELFIPNSTPNKIPHNPLY